MIWRHPICMLFLLAAGAPAVAGPGRCTGQAADEPSGQRMLVRLTVSENGAVASREAEWSLEAAGKAAAGGLSLQIGYAAPDAEGLGPVTTVTLHHMALRGPGLPAGTIGQLATGKGKPWTASFMGMMGLGFAQLSVKTPWGGRLNPQLAETIETAKAVTVTIFGPKRLAIEGFTVDPSDHSVRDRLFQTARTAAAALAAAPARCS
jgi:hypothetical protein